MKETNNPHVPLKNIINRIVQKNDREKIETKRCEDAQKQIEEYGIDFMILRELQKISLYLGRIASEIK